MPYLLFILNILCTYLYADNEQTVAEDLQADLSEKSDSVGSPSLKIELRKEEQKVTAGNLRYLMY